MAQVYKVVDGKPISKAIALNEGVQEELGRRTFEIAARADVLLIEHRQEGHAKIEVDHENVDWYVTLSDEAGQKAAMSIEYGREPSIDPETGEEKDGMEGLYILHQATHLAKRRQPKVKV